MALQASGQITATDIMAEWSYPASTQWKVSADGAGFISFTVGSIIKYSDFYNGSAASGKAYTFQMANASHNGHLVPVSNAGLKKDMLLLNGLGNVSTGTGFIVNPTDTPSTVSNFNIGGASQGMSITVYHGGPTQNGNALEFKAFKDMDQLFAK